MRVREYEMRRKDEGETDRPCRNPRNLSALSPDRTDKKIHTRAHTNACVCALLLNPITLSEAAFWQAADRILEKDGLARFTADP